MEDLMKVKYVGPVEKVEVPALKRVVRRNEEITVTNEEAKGLLGQSVWQKVETKNKENDN
jgi:hypothetical protein